MVVRRLDGCWVVIRQFDHSQHAGLLAQAWSEGPFGRLRQGLVIAAALHDIGWRGWDAHPALDTETGGPMNFPRVVDADHAGFYQLGIEEVTKEHAYAGYLVSLHASGIYSGRFGWTGLEQVAWPTIGPEGRRFLAGQVDYRRRLLPQITTVEPDAIEFATCWSDYMRLQTLDYLSLLCCLGLESGGCAPAQLAHGWGRLGLERRSAWEIALDPFPFGGSRLELPVTYRELPQSDFSDQEELLAALGQAGEKVASTVYVRAS